MCDSSFCNIFAPVSGWQTFSITDTGWLFIGSHGYHITIFTKINCNYFSIFCMKNLNNHIRCSRIFPQIITRCGIAGRNPATAEGITGTGVFISTVQINQYGSGYSPAGSIRLYRILCKAFRAPLEIRPSLLITLPSMVDVNLQDSSKLSGYKA